jgi:hypothetical protein
MQNIDSLLQQVLTSQTFGEQPEHTDDTDSNIPIDPTLLLNEGQPQAEVANNGNVAPPRRLRRRRSSNSETEHEARRTRLREFAEESMDRHNLGGDARDHIRWVTQVCFLL